MPGDTLPPVVAVLTADASRFRDELEKLKQQMRDARETVNQQGAGMGNAFDPLDRSTERASGDLDNLKRHAEDASGNGGEGEGLGMLMKAALLLGPAMAPIATVAAGAAVGLAGLFATVGAGVGIFALASKDVTASFEKSATAILSSWQKAMAPIVQPVFTDALKLLKPALADLTPVVKGVSLGLQSMEKSFGGLISSPATKQFFKWFGGEEKTVFSTLGPIIVNFGTGLMKAFQAAGPLINIVLGLIKDLSKAFADINFNSVLGGLAERFQELAPIVGKFLQSLMQVVGGILKAIGPIGTAVFQVVSTAIESVMPVVTTLGKVISAIAPVVGRVAQGLAGLLGTAIKGLAPIITSLLPIVTSLVKVLGGSLGASIKIVTPAVALVAKVIAQMAATLAGALGPALKGIEPLISALTPLTFVFVPVAGIIKSLVPVFNQLVQVVVALIGPIATTVGSLVSMAGTAEGGLVPAISDLVKVVGTDLLSAFQQIEPLLPEIGSLLGEAVGGGVGIATTLLKGLTPVIKVLLPVLTSGLIAALKILIPLIKDIPAPVLGMVLIFAKFHTGIMGTASSLAKLGGGLVQGVKDLALYGAQIADAIAQVVAFAVEHAAMTVAFIAENVAAAASATAAFIAENLATLGIIAGIALLVVAIVELVKHWHEIWTDIKAVATDAWHALDKVWQSIKGVFSDAVGWVVDFVRKHWELLIGIMTGPIGLIVVEILKHWHTIETDTSKFVGTIVGFFKKIPAYIGDAFKSAISWLYDAGRNIVQGLINGVEAMAQHALDVVEGLGRGLIRGIKSVLHILSPSKDMHDVGQFVVQGLIDGMNSMAGQLADTATKIGKIVGQSVKSGAYGGGVNSNKNGLSGPSSSYLFYKAAVSPFLQGPTAAELAQALKTQQAIQKAHSGGTWGGGSALSNVAAAPGTLSNSASGSGAAFVLEVHVDIDGKQFYQRTWPVLQTTLLQHKRQLVTLGMS